MTSARPFAWLLVFAVALSATPWESPAASPAHNAGAPVALERPSEAESGEGAEGGCCVCLCFSTSSPLLPAEAPAMPLATLAPGPAVAFAGSHRTPTPQARIVFHPPRRA